MTEDSTLTGDGRLRAAADAVLLEPRLALAVLACDDGSRVGDVFLIGGERAATLGRGDAPRGTAASRLVPHRQRPWEASLRPPLESPYISREQLRVTPKGRSLVLENLGKSRLIDGRGHDVAQLTVRPGEAFTLGDHLVLGCIERPTRMARLRFAAGHETRSSPFGEADDAGIVGESVAAWALREALAFLGGREAPVLILGPSGCGKELAAHAVHTRSLRRGKPLVCRNAATLPAGLIEAELFGTIANYPHHGSRERPGVIGEAEGGTLFLDEIGELPEDLQTRLLRLLDGRGEFQRLGDAQRRIANVRFVAATNRPVEALRTDIAARFKLRLAIPGLDERREDIPLLTRHLLREIARRDEAIGARYFKGFREHGPRATPRIAPELTARLFSHAYSAHTRELEALLWVAIASSPGDHLALTPEVEARLSPVERAPGLPSADEVRAALERAGGVQERAWRELGLANRYVLKRLVAKHGITTGDGEP